jgi:hypothetical protein
LACPRLTVAELPGAICLTAFMESEARKSDPVKKLMWSGLLAGMSTLVTVVATRAASAVWRRVFDEEPPE